MPETETETPRGRRRIVWRRIVLRTAAVVLSAVLLLAALAVALLPEILVRVDWPAVRMDLSDRIRPEQRTLFTNLTADIRFRVEKSDVRDLVLRGEGRLLDWPVRIEADVGYSVFGLDASGDSFAAIPGSPWRAEAEFAWSARGGWTVKTEMRETAFDETDPVLGPLVRRLLDGVARDVAFSGRLSFSASASATNGVAVPSWTASARVSGVSADLVAGETPVSLRGLRLRGGASGFGAHADVQPMFPRADSLSFADVTLSNVFASARATESAWLVTEAGADVLGGQARLYALFLDPEKLSAGFTLFLDEIDAGEVLSRMAGLDGEGFAATGRLHGKLPLRIREGREVSFGDAYLYSAPGETGTIRFEDSAPLMEKLAAAGIDRANRDNLEKALRRLDYSALAITLRREDGGHALAFRLEGSAASGAKTVPVTLGWTVRGDMESIANMGLRAAGAGRKKGETK